METQLDSIVELVEARLKLANEYLTHGYKLISVQTVAGGAFHSDSKSFYVKRQVCYVLGRIASVALFEPDKPQGRPLPAAGAASIAIKEQ